MTLSQSLGSIAGLFAGIGAFLVDWAVIADGWPAPVNLISYYLSQLSQMFQALFNLFDAASNAAEDIESAASEGLSFTIIINFFQSIGEEAFDFAYALASAANNFMTQTFTVDWSGLFLSNNPMLWDIVSWLDIIGLMWTNPLQFFVTIINSYTWVNHGVAWNWTSFFIDPTVWLAEQLEDGDGVPSGFFDNILDSVRQIVEDILLDVLASLRDSLYGFIEALLVYFLDGVWSW